MNPNFGQPQGSAVPPPAESPVAPAATVATDEDLDSLMGLIADLKTNQHDSAKVSQVVDALAQIPFHKAVEVAESPAFQKLLENAQRVKSGSRRPGAVINKGTLAENMVPWHFTDLKSPPPDWREGDELPEGHTQWVWNWVPERSMEVIVNGMRVRLYRRVPFSGPKVFQDAYMNVLDQEDAASEHAAYMMRLRQGRSGPEVGPPRDPTILSEATAAVRMRMSEGSYFPGMGTQGMQPVPVAAAAEGDGGEAQ